MSWCDSYTHLDPNDLAQTLELLQEAGQGPDTMEAIARHRGGMAYFKDGKCVKVVPY